MAFFEIIFQREKNTLQKCSLGSQTKVESRISNKNGV